MSCLHTPCVSCTASLEGEERRGGEEAADCCSGREEHMPLELGVEELSLQQHWSSLEVALLEGAFRE